MKVTIWFITPAWELEDEGAPTYRNVEVCESVRVEGGCLILKEHDGALERGYPLQGIDHWYTEPEEDGAALKKGTLILQDAEGVDWNIPVWTSERGEANGNTPMRSQLTETILQSGPRLAHFSLDDLSSGATEADR